MITERWDGRGHQSTASEGSSPPRHCPSPSYAFVSEMNGGAPIRVGGPLFFLPAARRGSVPAEVVVVIQLEGLAIPVEDLVERVGCRAAEAVPAVAPDAEPG